MKNKKIVLCFSVFVLFFLCLYIGNTYYNYINMKNNLKLIKIKTQDINKHYNNFVITNKQTNLYKKENDTFIIYGKINSDINLTLNNKEDEYFLIDGLDLYIKYSDVNAISSYETNNRYSNYIYFNKNIITTSPTSFYDYNGNFIYTINNSFDFKVLAMNDDSYGVVYNNSLMYIKKDNIQKEYDNINTEEIGKERIKTLAYHFIYNPATESCNQVICHTFSQLESHLKYIRDNDYFTLTLDELEMYLDGKIRIPKKSIVLTVDDGTIFNLDAIKMMEEYKTNFTMFVVTSWINLDNLKSNYLDLESHSDNMHNQYECPGYGTQGGGILCLDENKVLEDLKTSQEKLGGSNYFAYPFFDFNDRAIRLLKESGFHMAFIGQYNTDGYSYPNVTNKYMVPRKTIFSDTTLEEFVSYLN